MKEYQVFLPRSYDDGTPVEAEKFLHLKQRLLNQFGGFTEHPQDHKRPWKIAHVSFQNGVMLFRVLTEKGKEARRFFAGLKEDLKKEWNQPDILILETEAARDGELAGERI